MVDRIDMSLDDIIKKDRIRRPGRGNKFTGRARPAGQNRLAGAKRTAVKKVGAVRKTVKTKAPIVRRNTAQSTVRRNNPGTWKNDKFTTAPVDLRSSVLEITNLHYNVSDGDLKELFSEFGIIKKVTVHYDASGRSLGKAEVSFSTVSSASNAMKKYNGVSLDGRAMSITPKVSNVVKASIASRLGKPNVIQPKNSRPKPSTSGGNNSFRSRPTQGRGQSSNNRGQSSRGRGGARGGRGGRTNNRSPRKQVTKDELDRDLESYIQRN